MIKKLLGLILIIVGLVLPYVTSFADYMCLASGFTMDCLTSAAPTIVLIIIGLVILIKA